jgi:hypothetical protein
MADSAVTDSASKPNDMIPAESKRSEMDQPGDKALRIMQAMCDWLDYQTAPGVIARIEALEALEAQYGIVPRSHLRK